MKDDRYEVFNRIVTSLAERRSQPLLAEMRKVLSLKG
jgi:hypothetical protein